MTVAVPPSPAAGAGLIGKVLPPIAPALSPETTVVVPAAVVHVTVTRNQEQMLFDVDTVPMQVPGASEKADAATPPVFLITVAVPRVVSPGRRSLPAYRSVAHDVVPAAVLRHATVDASGPCVIAIETVFAVFVVFVIDAV